ncbi:putative Ig domain-containing protein [Leuconostoc falkenbergense]|uniref:putative Ig domain-containing protein n=1 Tax=Leuconostoc falkenbergense TaxID=2766470 RepID=UPI0024A9BEDF|nr:putative Ig domain-containing protein [Leuconostoc falkenbergense]MDI6553506.1 putative Ig domain-containing protein [Leuconostoc falkenbergense]
MMTFLFPQTCAAAYRTENYSAYVIYVHDEMINEQVNFYTNGELPGGLVLNPSTGEISGMVTSFAQSHSFNVGVTGTHDTTVVSIMVKDGPIPVITIDFPSVIKLTKDQFFAQQIIVSGGIGAISYGCHGLPKGMRCHQSVGVIYGRPEAFGGNTVVTITAIDSNNNKTYKTFTMRMIQDDS